METTTREPVASGPEELTMVLGIPRGRAPAAERGGMTQDMVELILGWLVTDARFRSRFFADPEGLLQQFDLVEHERDSLRNLDPGAVQLLIELLAERLDPRIRRG